MRHNRWRRVTGLVLSALVVALFLSPPVQGLANFPSTLRLALGEEQSLDFGGLPISAVIRGDDGGLLQINDQPASAGSWTVSLSQPLAVKPMNPGRCSLDLALFGVLPIRHIAVEVVPRPEVLPGGQSIGILLRTKGVTVVGHAPVDGPEGRTYHPARDAGIRVGDLIQRIDGVEVQSSQHVVFLVNKCAREGRPVPVEFTRDGDTLEIEIAPIFSERERIYQLGLYVRDGAAGVGTMTFCEPKSGVFVALGHVIADSTTNLPLEVGDGQVVSASVARVRPGKRGEPGEKEGTFIEDQGVIGSITANTEFGLVGSVTDRHALGGEDQVLPVALAREVRVGPAQIRTVVSGNRVETFDVEITRVDTTQVSPAPKGITLRVTDPALLEATGGIVQGMSGSPIIQDGRLVGAVTHVFVNDPARGYGVFAEWMLYEAGLWSGQDAADATAESEPALAAYGRVPGDLSEDVFAYAGVSFLPR